MSLLEPTVAECCTELASIRTRIRELRGLPVRGNVGKTSIDLGQTLEQLYREEARWLACLEAARRAAGQIGPRRREVF